MEDYNSYAFRNKTVDKFKKRADKKYAKDKKLKAKQTTALQQGKNKKVERISKRRTKVQEKAQDLDYKVYKAGVKKK